MWMLALGALWEIIKKMKRSGLTILLLIINFFVFAEESHFVLQGGEIHNTDTNLNKGSTVYAECNLRLRDSSDLKSSKIGLLLSGEKVKIVEIGKQDEIDNIKSNWIKVKNDKIEGWCFGGYVSSPKIISPRIFMKSPSLDSEETDNRDSFYLYNYDSNEIYCTFENCYLASETSWSHEWYPYVCFVNKSNKILYVYNLEDGTIIPTVNVNNNEAQYSTVTPNKKYLIYTYSNKGKWETESTRYVLIYEIKTQRLVAKVEKYCEEMNYVMFHFKENPSVLRINVDEECAGDGLLHAFYFNQDTEEISYGDYWNTRWND